MDYRSLNLLGTVRIAPTFDLAETAAKLGVALGVAFARDSPGAFDEFPSFSAECAGLSFALLGIPESHEQISVDPIVDYEFKIRMAFRDDDASEMCDASGYFADLIRERSDLTVAAP